MTMWRCVCLGQGSCFGGPKYPERKDCRTAPLSTGSTPWLTAALWLPGDKARKMVSSTNHLIFLEGSLPLSNKENFKAPKHQIQEFQPPPPPHKNPLHLTITLILNLSTHPSPGVDVASPHSHVKGASWREMKTPCIETLG